MNLQSGSTILHYRLLEQIGQGGMGVVYKAEDTKLKRTVALKFLPLHTTASEEEKTRFEHEAQAAAALDHPNICTVYEINEADGQAFIAMAFVEGHSLQDIVGANGRSPLGIDLALNYAIQIAEGLQAAHEKEIVHRDIKPANVLITEKGQVRITDFGLAKLGGRTQLTKEGSSMGTVAYMSPEQTQGAEVDHRTDIWALGAVIYEMITDKQPFAGDYDQAVIYSIMNEDPEPPTALRTGVHMELERIVLKALAKEPGERYQHIEEMLVDLKNLQKSQESPVSRTKQPGLVDGTGRPRRVALTKMPFLIGGVLVLIVAAAAVFWNSFPGNKSAPKSAIKRIAVLPLENLGPADQEYFADGITGEITSRLSGLSGLDVIARSSAMQYKKTNKSLQQIGEELRVDYVLEGTLQWQENLQSGKRIRVNPELIKIEDATQIWSQPYEADFSDAFKLQADIAATVAEALNITLVKSEQQSLLDELTHNAEAYDTYLRAMDYSYDVIDEENLRLAEKLYEKAIALDDNFVAAYARLSSLQSQLHWLHYERSEDNLIKSKANAERSLFLDPSLSEAHVAMGNYYYHGKLNYEPALQEYRAATRLQPNNAGAYAGIGFILRRQGRMVQAIEQFKKGFDLDPRNFYYGFSIGETYLLLRQYEQAIQFLDRAISLAPDVFSPYYQKAMVYLLSDGDTGQTRAVIKASLAKQIGVVEMYIKYALFRCDVYDGNLEAALKQLAGIEKMDDQFTFKPEDLLAAFLYRLMKNEAEANKKYDSARQMLASRIEENPEDSRLHSSLGIAYAGLARKAEAIRAGKHGVELLPISKEAWRGSNRLFDLAQIYAMTNEPNLAMDILDDLLAKPTNAISVALLKIDPTWEPLRQHPRFQKLLQKYSSGNGNDW